MQMLRIVVALLSDIFHFTKSASLLRLRSYQLAPARAILDSVTNARGLSIVVIMPRQSGKNELQAQLEAYLLRRFSSIDADMVKVSPTWKPQCLNAMRRLERVLSRNILTQRSWKKESGYIYRVGRACIAFLSGAPETNIVGQTASLLLQVDEAQDVQVQKYDKDIVNMAASTNATRVFWGTSWTSKTLLARERRAAAEAEAVDGVPRVFLLSADDVRRETPPYGAFVDEQIRRLGRNHPLVRTQLFSEEIDSEGGMFNTRRQALMQGDHLWRETPEKGRLYAMLLDLAGEDENAAESGDFALANEGRDHTALTIAQVDLATLADPLVKAPTYRVVFRKEWAGDKHTALYGKLLALAALWQVRYIVCDSTGVGAGLTSFLHKAMPEKVVPFLFTRKSKSLLGWGFLAIVETGRYKEYLPTDADEGAQRVFWQQARHCLAAPNIGQDRILAWGVPDGTRDEDTGELVHDDLLISASLCHILDGQRWGTAVSAVIAPPDLLADLDPAY